MTATELNKSQTELSNELHRQTENKQNEEEEKEVSITENDLHCRQPKINHYT